MNDAALPPPARASAIGEFERISHRREWRIVHIGFDTVYVSSLVLLTLISVNTAVVSLLGYDTVIVEPLRLFAGGLPVHVLIFSGTVALAWLAMILGALMMARAPGHMNLKIYALIAAILLTLGALAQGWAAIAGLGLLSLYLHGLGRCWYYDALRRHGVVLLFALAILVVTWLALRTSIPAGFAFAKVIAPVHHDLPAGAPLALITALLPWWLWGLWFMHVVHLARRVTAVIQQPRN